MNSPNEDIRGEVVSSPPAATPSTGAVVPLAVKSDTAPNLPGATVDFAVPAAGKSDTAPNLPGATVDLTNPAGPASQASPPATISPKPPDASSSENLATGDWQQAEKAAEVRDFSLAHPGLVATMDSKDGPPVKPVAKGASPTVPNYEILGELGRGGMGVVYKARHVRLNRVVALKMVLAGAHASPDQLLRFQSEAEAVAMLQHPNIVQIHEVGECQGLPFFSLEFVDGLPLDKKLAGKPQPHREAAQLMETLARAMHFAHTNGIVHRDLKPANVLVSKYGVPKITDFGLAKKLEADSSQTKSGALMGTPSYMSPEQRRGETNQAGPPADIHALGAMLYEFLTGRPPFMAASAMDTIMQVVRTEPIPPRKLVPKLSRDLETICLKCLQKEPLKRYATAEALADDLKRFVAGEPIMARPVSAPERSWRWCKRNPRVAVLSVVVLLLLATAGTAFGKLALGAAQERQASVETRKLAGQRLEQAVNAIAIGDARRASDLLHWTDSRLNTAADLVDIRADWQRLKEQVDVYAEFKRLLDQAHYSGLSGGRENKLQAQEICGKLIELYEAIKQRSGRGAAGLPPLNPQQQQLFNEDQFEAFLLAALVEWDLHSDAGADELKQAAERGIPWLNEAETLVPPTRALHVRRSALWSAAGDPAAAEADVERADAIEPTSAIDHFWRGFADYRRAEGDRGRGDNQAGGDHYRQAIAEYAAVLRLNPRHFWAWTQWAACHFQLGNYADALVGFSACIDINPEHPWPFGNRGVTQLRLSQFDPAVEDCNAALARDAHYSEGYWIRGLVRQAQGQDDAAVDDFAQAIREKLDLEQAYLDRAALLCKLKRHDEALADLEQLIARAADPTKGYLRRAELYRELDRTDEALADYSACLERKPGLVDARYNRALIHAQQQHPESALADLDEIIMADPDNVAAHATRADLNQQLKRLEAAVADIDEVVRLQPNNASAYTIRAEINHQLKRPEAALRDYTRLVELGHELATNYGKRAGLYQEMGRGADAIQDLDGLIELKPDDVNALFSRAGLHFNAGHTTEARDDFSAVIRLAPKAPQPYRFRAFINLVMLKDLAASLADWQELARLVPQDAEAHYYAGVIQMGLRRYPEALAALEEALKLKPGYVEAHWARGQVYLFQKRYDESLAEFDVLVEKLAPNKAETHNSRGDVYRAMGRLDEAAADYRKLIERKPEKPDASYEQAAINAYVSLAGVLAQQGQAEEARVCYDQLVAANPNSVPALLHRADDHRQGGRFEEALADCNAAAKIDPKSMLPGLLRACAAASRGEHSQAVVAAEKLLADSPANDGHVTLATARALSLAAGAALAEAQGAAIPEQAQRGLSESGLRYAERAAELLAATLDRGFHDLLYPEHNRLRIDSALDPIRTQPRVRELLGE